MKVAAFRRSVALVALVVLLAAFASVVQACGGSSTTTQGIDTTAVSSPGGGAEVTMKNLALDPVTVTIKAGESVTWTNEDAVGHPLVGDNGEFDSGSLSGGDSFTFTFETAGTYTYHCTVHPNMKGTVNVE